MWHFVDCQMEGCAITLASRLSGGSIWMCMRSVSTERSEIFVVIVCDKLPMGGKHEKLKKVGNSAV